MLLSTQQPSYQCTAVEKSLEGRGKGFCCKGLPDLLLKNCVLPSREEKDCRFFLSIPAGVGGAVQIYTIETKRAK